MLDRVKTVLDRLLIAFKDGVIPKAVAYQKFQTPNIPCRKWSFLNQIMVFVSGTEDARGYRQWQEVNRFVKKGSKGFDILVPWIKNKDTDEETIKGFMCKTVFRYEDTDGEKLEYEDVKLPELPLLEKARSWGLDIKATGFDNGYYGCFIPSRNVIYLATPEEKTLFHELAHYADQQTNGNLKAGQDPLQEIVAELSAQALCQIVGRTMDSQLGNSYEYIQYYSEKLKLTPYIAVLQVINRIDKVLNYILKEDL